MKKENKTTKEIKRFCRKQKISKDTQKIMFRHSFVTAFADDLMILMKHSDGAIAKTIVVSGKNNVKKLCEAIGEIKGIANARGVIASFVINPNMTLVDLKSIINAFAKITEKDRPIIWNCKIDSKAGDKLSASILITK